jgi:restriction endonuclease Mrr
MFKQEDFQRLRGIDQIENMKWKDFEWFSKFFLEARGHKSVFVTKKSGEYQGDRGIDTVSEFNGEKFYSQCKRWSPTFRGTFKGQLPVRVIRELGGCMLRDKVNRGVFFTTLTYDETARKEAQQMNIELFGKHEIAEAMHALNPKFRTKPRFKALRFIWRIIVGFLRLVIYGD